MRNKLKIDRLAKLRQYRDGDDISDFLSTQFRQIVRALEQAYVKDGSGTAIQSAIDSLAPNYAISQNSGFFSTNSGTYVDVTNLSVKITSKGNPVELRIYGKYIAASNASGDNAQTRIALYRDGVQIHEFVFDITSTGTTNVLAYLPQCLYFMDEVGAGTYTYSVKARTLTGFVRLNFAVLQAKEI